MSKLSVIIDDGLIERVMKLYTLETKQEAINFALQTVAGSSDRLGMLAMKGSGWDGDLRTMRRSIHQSL